MDMDAVAQKLGEQSGLLIALNNNVSSLWSEIGRVREGGEKRDKDIHTIETSLASFKGEVSGEFKAMSEEVAGVKKDVAELKDESKWARRAFAMQIISALAAGALYAVTHWPK